MQYDHCLVDFSSVVEVPDCASAYMSCDAADNDCEADLAQCKNSCAVVRDTCQTSGDEALLTPCLKQYDSCLVDFTVAKSAIGEDCVASYLSCDGADNVCSAGNAQCKNKCAEVCLKSLIDIRVRTDQLSRFMTPAIQAEITPLPQHASTCMTAASSPSPPMTPSPLVTTVLPSTLLVMLPE